MVYKTRITACPYCKGNVVRTTKNDRGYDGSPFRHCPNCHRVYFDGAYQEPAIAIYEDKGGEFNFWGLLFAVGGTILTVSLLINGIWAPACLIGIFSLIADIALIRLIINRANSTQYHKRQVDYLEGRRGTITPEIKESIQRMSSKAYLDDLKSHGVKVPAYFYKRLEKSFDKQLEDFFELDSKTDEKNRIIPSEHSEDSAKSGAEEGAKKAEFGHKFDAVSEDKTKSFDKENGESKEIRYCHKCGQRLFEDSVFCSKCGTRVRRE